MGRLTFGDPFQDYGVVSTGVHDGRFEASNPEPGTRTPNPKSRNPNPEPQTSNPKPQTPNPKPDTSNPKPQTINPQPQSPNQIMYDACLYFANSNYLNMVFTPSVNSKPEGVGLSLANSPPGEIKSLSPVSLIFIGVRRNLATCGANQGARKRRFAPTLRAGGQP